VAQLFSLGHESYEAYRFYIGIAGSSFYFAFAVRSYQRVGSTHQRHVSTDAFDALAFVVSFLYCLGILHFPPQPAFGLALRRSWYHSVDFDDVASLFADLSYDEVVA
jgi:hypothetical protein